LVEQCTADRDLPPLRAALATGAVIVRAGDYHGETVHLAARMLKEAGSGAVVADRATALGVARGDARLVFAPASSRVLRGFDEPIELVNVSRRETPAAVA